ncbi:MAG: isoaspartyl peptidase/L-asparaginase [Anaerolineae bacterium]|jgi:isoaspartyl peptidase/L-asparaginase-like protein (Ntn-hydrolase superfamily)
MRSSIIVHGGAWDIPSDGEVAHRQGTERAVEAGWAVLTAGGSAMDAIEAAIVVMEDDETWWHYNTPHMAYAYRTADMKAPFVGL